MMADMPEVEQVNGQYKLLNTVLIQQVYDSMVDNCHNMKVSNDLDLIV